MGSIWELGLKQDGEGVAKKGKVPQGKVDLRRYGFLCMVLAVVLAAAFILIIATGQLGVTSSIPLLSAALVGPIFLAVIGLMLLRIARHGK
ncbi:MAG: hypothetical protein WCK39_05235 [Methanomassiliicoccales archaeon]